MRIEEMTFRSDGVDCAARVYRPDAQPGEATPCVVMANGFSLTREDGMPAFAERFAGAGVTALTFDFRYLGASGGEPRQLIDAGRQHADFRAAVSFARGLEGIDADAVAVWGFSFGGGHAVYTAANDHKIAAAVALCPATDVISYVRSMPGRNSLGAGVVTLRNVVGRQRVHFPVVGRPGSMAWFTQPEALPGFEAVCDDRSLWRNEFLPLSFATSASRAVRVAHRVTCPLFVTIGEKDRVVSRKAAERTAERAPRGERGIYPIDHFGGFLGEDFECVVADQIEFLSRHLLTVQTPGSRATS
ncbi:MAG: alpha/beta hydrolase [Solirubrobacterales bacterium]